MPLFNIAQLRIDLPRHTRVLGLDPGERVIGLALSDVSLTIASSYGSLPRRKLSSNAAEIARIAAKENVGWLLCGLPLSLDGSFGPAAQAVRDWLTELSRQSGIPASLWDERLSSSAVNRMLITELDTTRKRRAALVDKLAAAYILQSALDASRGLPGSDGGRDRV